MCRVDSNDYADLYRTENPIARREHKCQECRRIILRGEHYQRHSIIADGSASTHIICSHCAVLSEWVGRECGGTMMGELIEDIEEHARDYERHDLGHLAALARAQWMKGPTHRVPYPGVPIPQLPPGLSVNGEASHVE